MSIKMDLTKFKHLSSDDKSTTLQHKDGHVLKLAHGGLAKASIEALKAMAQSSIESDSAEEGVDKANKKRKEGKGSEHGEVIVVDKDKKDKKDYGKVVGPDGEKPSVFAEGGEVKKYAEGDMVEESTPEIPPMLAKDPVQDPLAAGLPQPQPIVEKDPITAGAIKEYNMRVQAQGNPAGSGLEIGPSGEAPQGGINAPLWDKAKLLSSDRVVGAQAEQMAAQQKASADLQKQNAIRAELGQPLLPDPNAQVQAPQGVNQQPMTYTGAEQQGAQQPVPASGANPFDPSTGVNSGYETQIAGLKQQAQAQGDLGKEQAAIAQKQQEANQIAQQTFQQHVNDIDNDTKAYAQDIQNGYIDPNKYWTGYTAANGEKVAGHSRVAAGIGMILAGFGGLEGAKQVQGMIQNQINQSIEAQKANLNSSHNLLRANLDRFRNVKDATDMTRVMMNENFMAQMNAAAAKAQTPLAKAAAMQAIGPLQRENAQLQTKIALNQAIMKAANNPAAMKNPETVGHLINQLDSMGDPRAKELKERFVPGVGLSSVPVPQDVRMEIVGKNNFDSLAKHYVDWVNKNAGTLNPAKISQGVTMAAELQSAYRNAIKGGVYKEGEQEFIEKLIPSKPDQFLSSMRTIPKLNELINTNHNALNTLKQGYGLPTASGGVQQPDIVTGKDGRQYRRQGNYMVPIAPAKK